MPRRVTNLFLLVAGAALLVSGFGAWLVPASLAGPFELGHRAAGFALLVALAWKIPIARGSLRRRLRGGLDRSMAVGIAGTIALLLTIALGFGWTFGLLSFDRPWAYSALNLHVFIGLALAGLVLWHLAARRESPPAASRLLTRRNVIRVLGVGAAGAALVPLLEPFADQRRETGSKHARSFSANDFPVTIWTFDSVPLVDVDAWRLRVTGAVARPDALSLATLDLLPRRETSAVIDCTGGWWSEQRWSGYDVTALLDRADAGGAARHAEFVSLSGHRWTFDLADLEGALLATHVGGAPLSAAHGFPVRLVVPGRRGFQWIKWLDRIEVG